MALSASYGHQGRGNIGGARSAIAMIFLYSCGYAVVFNATIWVVPSEMFPFFLRSTGMGLAVFSKAVAAIVLSQVTPAALQNIGWRYYALFIASSFVAAFVYFFLLPETGGKSLGQIAELFGDSLPSETSEKVEAEGPVPSKAQAKLESNASETVHMERIV